NYRGEVATLSKQVANLHKLLGNPCLPTFNFSSTPVAEHRSGLVEVSPPCRLSTAVWPVLCRDPSMKGSPPSLENGASRMLLDDLGDVLVLDPTNQPWRYKASSGNGGLLGDVEPGPDTDQKRLCCSGSRGSGAFFLEASELRADPEVPEPSSSVLSPYPVASTSGSDPQSSHPHQTVRLPERPAHSSSTMDTTAGSGPSGPTAL
ncbi:unnamed protein product, partial [Coregonus sp. 'balchen']